MHAEAAEAVEEIRTKKTESAGRWATEIEADKGGRKGSAVGQRNFGRKQIDVFQPG